MSPHVERCFPWLVAIAVGLSTHPASAQTIADYSRAQRALLENAMTQAAARSAGLGASAPGVAASATVIASLPAPRTPLPSLAPALRVSGVFASSAGAVAEVVVDATAYLLGPGQGVPGTPWHVESVTIDRVVLNRREAGNVGVAVEAQGARQVFALPALR